MRSRSAVVSVVALSFVAASCGETPPTSPEKISIPVFIQGANDQSRFGTHMKGDEEVPPVATKAQGQAEFTLSADGTSMDYKLIVANIENVTQSHIHIGPFGANGPVVVFLFGFVAGGVTENGVLAEGTIRQSNLIARPAIGFGATMPELISRIRAGNAYVNVHTVRWPGGEVRGQLEEKGGGK